MDANAKRRKDAPRRLAIALGFAFFLGAFSLLNLIGELRSRHFDANIWWISFRPLPDFVGRVLLLLAATVLVAFAIRPACGVVRRRTTLVVTSVLLLTTLANAMGFYVLLVRREIMSTFPVPLSLLLVFALVTILLATYKNHRLTASLRASRFRWSLATFSACLIAFPTL